VCSNSFDRFIIIIIVSSCHNLGGLRLEGLSSSDRPPHFSLCVLFALFLQNLVAQLLHVKLVAIEKVLHRVPSQ
jgi:hypothetical protein